MKYIDIHCHLNLPDFDQDQAEVIASAKELGVGMIVVGVDAASSQRALEIAKKNDNIWAVVGLHPADNVAEDFDSNFYKKLARHPKVVGIGECGLDYFHAPYDKEKQLRIFEQQIVIAQEVEKPLMLHIRNGKDGENAYADGLEILRKYANAGMVMTGDVHFFAGNLEEARLFVGLGFRLSFTGVITFAHNYDEVIKNISLNMILSETDAPYVAPLPYRGKRNEPAYVVEVVRKIAEIRGEDVDTVGKQLLENARHLFSLN